MSKKVTSEELTNAVKRHFEVEDVKIIGVCFTVDDNTNSLIVFPNYEDRFYDTIDYSNKLRKLLLVTRAIVGFALVLNAVGIVLSFFIVK